MSVTVAAIGTAVGSILSSIASIAGIVGLDRIVNKYDRYKLEKDNINMVELSADIKSILSRAQSKGNRMLSDVINRINNLPTIVSGSDLVRDAIRQQKVKLHDISSSIEQTMDNEVKKVENLKDKLTEISYDPDYLKDTKLIKNIEHEAKKNRDKVDKQLSLVEKRLQDV